MRARPSRPGSASARNRCWARACVRPWVTSPTRPSTRRWQRPCPGRGHLRGPRGYRLGAAPMVQGDLRAAAKSERRGGWLRRPGSRCLGAEASGRCTRGAGVESRTHGRIQRAIRRNSRARSAKPAVRDPHRGPHPGPAGHHDRRPQDITTDHRQRGTDVADDQPAPRLHAHAHRQRHTAVAHQVRPGDHLQIGGGRARNRAPRSGDHRRPAGRHRRNLGSRSPRPGLLEHRRQRARSRRGQRRRDSPGRNRR